MSGWSEEEMARRVQIVEAQFHASIASMLEGMPVAECRALLWRFVEGRPTGEALARRAHKAHEEAT